MVGSSVEWRFGPVFGGRAVLIDGCGYGKVVAACHVTRGWSPLFVGGLGDGEGSLGLVTALWSLLSGIYAYTNKGLHNMQLTSSRPFAKHRDVAWPRRFGVIDLGVRKTVWETVKCIGQ